MSELKKEFENLKNYSVKWEKYFSVYEKFFSKFKNKKIIFVEIGIFNGGSLQMWKNYFGKNSKIIGVDINPECKKFEEKENDIFVEIGNQSDDEFWKLFFNKHGKVDAILDDGGHTNLDQIKTTVNTVQHINNGGVLMVEDTHTSYVDEYNSSQKYSFINFSKKVIDDLNSNIDLDLGLKINFSLKKYKLALKAQTKVLLRYQKSVKVADALLVIGSSHRELGNNEEARKAWSALIDKFPDTRLAIKARNRLENLPDSQF